MRGLITIILCSSLTFAVVFWVGYFFDKPVDTWYFVAAVLLSVLITYGYWFYLSHPKSRIAERIEEIVMFIVGFLAIAGFIVLVFWGIALLLPSSLSLRGTRGGISLLTLIILTVTYAWRAAHAIEVKNLTIPIDNLQTLSKMIYFSDIHIAKKSDLPFLQKIITKINSIEADFVVINGDFVDGRGFDVGDFALLDEINKPIIYTYGNHEAYAGNEYVKSLLEPTKMIMLSDQKVQIAGWEILGLADIHAFDNVKGQKLLTEKLRSNTRKTDLPKMLVLHEPIGPQVAEQFGVNFQVAGHTHNGQIFPFTLLVKFAFPYIKGRYRFTTSSLFVSSGVGTRGPDFRLGSRSEILVFDFVRK